MKANEECVTVWGIHCTIEEESMFHKNSVMAIGWNDMGDLSKIGKTRDAFKAAYQEVWPGDSKMTVAVQAGQVYRFACEVKVGDYVVFEDMLHYTTVKTHTFNGVSHPAIAMFKMDGGVEVLKTFGYEDYRNRMD